MFDVSRTTAAASWWALGSLVFVFGCGSSSPSHSEDQQSGINAAESGVSNADGVATREAPAELPNTSPSTQQPVTLQNVQNGRALLIGCSRYPLLADRFQLKGPANDVVLTRKLLIERFGFPADNIVLLSEDAGGDDQLPTRANIEREWQQLAAVSRPGDQVVVLMSGHGSQAPQSEESEDDIEPDGLDEIFLPRDVGKWEDGIGQVENSILDDELREWIQAIQATGASLFLVFDACYSGTMTRGGIDDVKRELPRDQLGVPTAALPRAAAGAAAASNSPNEEAQLVAERHGPTQTRSVTPATQVADSTVVALYGAQSSEPTIETELPVRGQNRKSYGLLTYTLNQVLMQVESKITYRELVERIHRRYLDQARYSPTPVIEGSADHIVLGIESFPQRSRVRITGNRRGWKVNAGALSGLTKRSILAVYPPAGEKDADKVLGHVRILEEGFSAVESKVEPCEFSDLPAPEKLAAGMRCETVYVDFGDQRLRLAADTATDANEPLQPERRQELVERLTLPDELKQLIDVVAEPADADWLLRYDSLASNQLFLVPASGWPGNKEGELPPLFGPVPQDEELMPELSSSLRKIHRVQTLLRISGGGSARSRGTSMLDVSVMRYQGERSYLNETDLGKVVVFERGGIKLHAGDYLRCRIKNSSRKAVDVTLLWVDSDYGIDCVFPDSGADNRIVAGGNLDLHLGTIKPEHTGLEHLVAIAVEAKAVDQSTSFAFLRQEVIARTRAVESDSPLEKLFKTAMYGIGTMRALDRGQIDSYQIRTKSFTTSPKIRAND